MRVSVIIPTFNRAHYLQGAIDSVLSQDCADKEIIIVDDCSTDGTQELCARYAGNDVVKCFRNTQNMGQAFSQNKGISLATGDLICTLDDDDFMNGPDSLSVRVKAFQENEHIEFLWTSGQDIMEDGRKCNINKSYAKTCMDEWLKDDIYINSIMFYKKIKEKIGGYFFDESLSSNEDWDFKIRCMIHCNCTFIQEVTVLHRCYSGMRSAQHRQTGELQHNEDRMRDKLRKLYGGLFW